MARPPRKRPAPTAAPAGANSEPSERSERSEPAEFEVPAFDPAEFDSGVDERMEALATQGRWPLRLAASALLRVDARTDRLRHRRPGPELRDESIGALPDDLAAPPEKPVAARSSQAKAAPRPVPVPAPAKAKPSPSAAKAKPPSAQAGAVSARRTDPTAEKLQQARRQHQVKLAKNHDGDRAALDEEAWESWAGGADQNTHPDVIAELDMGRRRAGRAGPKTTGGEGGLRKRVSGALDRWAAKETDTWTKAEHRVFHDRNDRNDRKDP